MNKIQKNIQQFAQFFSFLTPKQRSLSATETLNTSVGSAKPGIQHTQQSRMFQSKTKTQNTLSVSRFYQGPKSKDNQYELARCSTEVTIS